MMRISAKSLIFALAAAILSATLSGCVQPCESAQACRLAAEKRSVDYAKPENWVMLPDCPAEERKPIDVFYVYPTVFASRKHAVMHWDSEEMRTKTRNIAGQQTGPFLPVGNVYAPFVRQGELHLVLAALAERPGTDAPMEIGFRDTVDAFRYYLKHWNGGRPFILVGHSQGAYDLLALLKREFKDPALRKKLIAAYLIGCPITDADLAGNPHLKMAEGPIDSGVIVTWNSEAREAAPSLFTGRPGTRCINPLNWRTDAVPAPAAANVGAVFFDGEGRITGEIPAFCGAEIRPETGALVVTPEFPGQYDSSLLGAGIYHMNDIYFFYRNLEINARDRAASYFNAGGQEK
ncbi:DUF3089 domain-containing protein [uncultured Victivallis sp.]|uniref:DUF3089 domain-containing protein n=1 Tax=uncultured Victivallis sp. TaxID=354118 RepID=UPI0025D9511C|nr:DUF3089 domain-containing protein [uncultured Victivallis sp.]